MKAFFGQTFQAQPGNPNRVVPLSTGIQSVVLQVGPSSSGLVCDQIQSQTTQFCVTGSGSESLGGGRSEPFLGTDERLCIPSSIPASPSSFETKVVSRMILIAPGWPNMPWFGDLVDLSIQIPFSLPLTRDLVTQPPSGSLQ